MSKPARVIGIEDRVELSPRTWPAGAAVPPGDLGRYAPNGSGTGDPIRNAPADTAEGGTLYFEDWLDLARLRTALMFLNVAVASKDYAAFGAESANPAADRYLAQIRIVTSGALPLFGAASDSGAEPLQQPLTIGELIEAFVDAQRAIWTQERIAGSLGGDGDWASERVSFGFLIENGAKGVYRLWSRPWLVTK